MLKTGYLFSGPSGGYLKARNKVASKTIVIIVKSLLSTLSFS